MALAVTVSLTKFKGEDAAIRIPPIVVVALEIIRYGHAHYAESPTGSSSTRLRYSCERCVSYSCLIPR